MPTSIYNIGLEGDEQRSLESSERPVVFLKYSGGLQEAIGPVNDSLLYLYRTDVSVEQGPGPPQWLT